jgi:hypothetical protein
LSSQTTGANEYFSKTISWKFALFFFVAMFLLYFILFLSVKSAFPLHSLQKKHGPSEKLQQICLHTGRMANRCRFIEGVLSRSGRLFSQPAAATQKTLHGTDTARKSLERDARHRCGRARRRPPKRRKTAGPSVKPSG